MYMYMYYTGVNYMHRLSMSWENATMTSIFLNAFFHHQIEMLKSLGLQSVLFTDGNSPINLFQSSQDTKTVQAMMAAKTT